MYLNPLKPSWWINMLITTAVTMVFIYLIKQGLKKVNVPIATQIAAEV